MKTNSLNLLHALNAAAVALQQPALSEAEVLRACREEIARLGLRGGLSLLDDTGEWLVVRETVQPEWMIKVLGELERRTGYQAKNYTFQVTRVATYHQAIETRRAVFVIDSSPVVTQLLPDLVRPLAHVILRALGALPGIYAPLNKKDRAIGVLNVVGAELTAEDIPAVQAFADHIAIALDNARLFAALRESEQRFRTLAEASFEGIAITEQGLFVDLNDQLAQMLGYRRDELIGKSVMQMVAPESQAQVAEAIRSDQLEPYEHFALKQDGTIFPVETRARTMCIGDHPVRITAIRDVTERRHAEEALRASENKFSTAFHISPDSININRLSDGQYIEINEGFTMLAGYTPEDVQNKTWTELDIWADLDDRERLVQELREHGMVNNLEARLRLKDGTVRVGLMSARIIQVNSEPCILSITRDITERKQADLERENLIAELEARNAELERFTYTVSHELKAPLVTIRGFLGFLEKDAVSGNLDRLRADIGRITPATGNMQRLLTELLELSRIGRMMDPQVTVPFEAIAGAAVELVREHITRRGVQVEVAPNLPTICGDQARLVEVVQNLVDNAVKFMGEQTQPRIEIGQRGADDKSWPILFVRDNGIGIEPQYHERVFGLFNKLDAHTDGTGVGLALVKRIVTVHGGHIWVESEGTGKGTTFCFTLPTRPTATE
jgi:PAS domain S-box-containing protein